MDFAQLLTSQWDVVFTGLVIVVLLLAGIYAWVFKQRDTRQWLMAGLFGALILMGLQIKQPLMRLLLLDTAALAAVALVWLQNRQSGGRFFTAVLVGSLLAGIGLSLSGVLSGAVIKPDSSLAKVAVALILVGFSIKLALVPFYFWLTSLAESSSVMTSVLVIGILDMAEAGELLTLRADAPWMFTQWQAAWLVMALLAMLGGALLALAQTDLRRMLAFSAIDDSGYLLIGVLAGSSLGLAGAMAAILSHALCKFLLFGALGCAEHGLGKKITLATHGLASQFPVSGAAFIAGALGMIGVPPFLGSVGRWRLYLSGMNLGGLPLALAMALASILALLYYVRAIHRVWLGKPEEALQGQEPGSIKFLLGLVMALILLSGLALNFGMPIG